MFCIIKYHKILFLILPIILLNCQLNEPTKNHGIVFLENRANKLVINKSNKNDVLKIIGQPHTKSIDNANHWIYFERVLTKGSFHKLGQNIVKTNNLLQLEFDKYGILKNKKLIDKNEIKKVDFSKMETNNELTQKSFIEKFLQSVKTKMYKNNASN